VKSIATMYVKRDSKLWDSGNGGGGTAHGGGGGVGMSGGNDDGILGWLYNACVTALNGDDNESTIILDDATITESPPDRPVPNNILSSLSSSSARTSLFSNNKSSSPFFPLRRYLSPYNIVEEGGGSNNNNNNTKNIIDSISEINEPFPRLPPEAVGLEPWLLEVALNPNVGNGAGRLWQRMRDQRGGVGGGIGGNRMMGGGGDADDAMRRILGGNYNVVDPDLPAMEVLWRSLLPWNRVDGVRPPPPQ